MDNKNLIQGAGGGGKGGGGSSRPAQEAANTLRSRQYARVIDALCEGEIEGLVGLNQSTVLAEQSIYFDGVPLRNELGQPNFNIDAFSWSFVPGTQNQSVIPIGGTVASEIQVGQEVKYGNTGGGPVVRAIPETYINACRVTVMVPRLTYQDTTNGDISGTSVKFAIDVDNNGGGFVQILAPEISGKTNSEYQRSYEFDLPSPGPWNIRVRRLTEDSEKANVQNQLFWSTYTKIIKQPLNYPNTALIGLKVDSALFSKIPSRAYKTRLLKVKVPSNYNPTTRVYTGFWDGTFKTAWTDNPAWCWYDLATNTRYGLGDYIDVGTIDKWTLYSIAQYCDELVPDGFGGQEPRFTCNLLLNTREEALKVLMNFASIFRGIVYWHSNTIFCSQDKPSNPVKLFTPANVLNGIFNYSGSAKQARHTVAMVSWNDPDNQYRQTVEYVEDRESIIRLGVMETEVTAMGCTSRGQANRLGRWILLTEREETDTISFKTGIEGCGVMPGEIIQTTDPVRAGERLGGRIISATKSTLTLDATVTLEPGKQYTIAVILPSGIVEEKTVSSSPSTTSTINLATELAEIPQQNAIWILQTETLVPELWRVLSAVETEPNIVEITAIEHVPGKYAAIEQNLKLEARVTSNLNLKPGPVTNLNAITDIKKLNELEYTTRIFVSWTPPQHAVRYVVTWQHDNNNEVTQITTTPTIDIDSVPAGTYKISVAPENAIGLRGPTVTITHIVAAGTIEPDVQNLRLNPNFLSQDCPIIWDRLDWAIKYTVQVFDPSNLTTPLREEPVETNSYTYTYSKNLVDGGPRRNLLFKVKAHSWRGISANWAQLTASNPAPSTPNGIRLEAGPAQVGIFAERPDDPDLEGLIIWMAETSDVPILAENIIYKGKDNAYVKTGLNEAKSYYFKLAFYDTFGTTGLNISSSSAATTLAAKGIVMVTTLPNSPEDIAGQTAVFLDVEESTGRRGVWGWDGTAWAYTRDGAYLVANSVTADKINANKLSAISANLGEITSGNITLDATSAIKGGALTFSSGTGFWQGYETNSYKWRVGSPTSSRAEWTGNAFNIYDSSGNVTISSGIVDWEAISGDNKADNNATRNVFTGNWVSTQNYSIGDIVLKDGNGWSCILAHTSSQSNQPPSSGTSNTWWTLYAVKGDSAQYVIVTGEQAFKYAANATTPTNTSITLTAQLYGGLSTYSWEYWNGTQWASLSNTTNTFVLAYNNAAFTGNALRIRCSSGSYYDEITIVKLYDGSNTRTGYLTNETVAVATLSDGTGASYTNAGGTFKVFNGITDVTASSTFSIQGGTDAGSTWTKTQNGLTLTVNETTGVYSLSGSSWTTDIESFDLVATYSGTSVTKTYTITKAKQGIQGASSIHGVLSNEAHTLPATSDGTVTSFIGATTTLTIYNGTLDDSANWTYSAIKNNVTCSEVATSRTQTVTAMSADTGYIDITASRTGYSSITKRFTLSKSKAGSAGDPGSAGPTITITSDRAATFTATDDSFDASQSNIIFSAVVTGLTNPTYSWSFVRQDGSGTTPTASTSSTFTITPANFGTSKSAVVTCLVNNTYKDTFTIVLLQRSTAVAGATKNIIYYQTTTPSSANDGDIWVDTDSSPVIQYVRSSGAWNASSTVGATFNSGTGQISGQITQSNATTYIANAAIGTAQIIDTAITNAKIANAAITTAKIGDAQVDTLKLQGNAVTIPVSASSSGHSSSVTIDCGDIPLTVCVMATTSGSITPPNGVTTHYLVGTLYQNGVAIASTNFTSGSFAYSGMPGFGCCSFNLTFPNLTGLHTFTVQISQAVNAGSWGGGRSGIIALGVKR